ncbi:MAG: helix-turn-helix domain-containing protein [Chloroflexota bacterium]|jgi:excisionase family DNA binding protein|nr:helix-turn-helix domain-containing protein [Chloroflexota bacterium]
MSGSERERRPAPARPMTENEDDLRGPRWLTLKDASRFLGVHYTTVRTWADRGELRVFRTPGGHRRFSVTDLRQFLEERAGHAALADTEALVDVAVSRVRQEIRKMPRDESRWRDGDDDGNDLRRQRGRQLFALAIAFVLKPNQRERILREGRELGQAYGSEAALNGVGLRDTGKAVQFFRSQLTQVLRSGENPRTLDADDVRVRQMIDLFLDEVLYAVLDGYERQLAQTDALPTSQIAPAESSAQQGEPPDPDGRG